MLHFQPSFPTSEFSPNSLSPQPTSSTEESVCPYVRAVRLTHPTPTLGSQIAGPSDGNPPTHLLPCYPFPGYVSMTENNVNVAAPLSHVPNYSRHEIDITDPSHSPSFRRLHFDQSPTPFGLTGSSIPSCQSSDLALLIPSLNIVPGSPDSSTANSPYEIHPPELNDPHASAGNYIGW